MKKLFIVFLTFFLFISQTQAFTNYFTFWLRLHDNEYELVPKIENKFNTKVPLVSIIYDDFSEWEAFKLAKTFKTLWNDRVYHISINPFGYNLKDLIDNPKHMWWERKYRALFRLIKKYDVKVIFRSLHEMNWWWYSRSSDPYRFPIFWKMMWNWSREEWLDRSNILFDFSINSQDLPAVEWSVPSQTTPVMTCNQTLKKTTWCLTFEDYYPWDEYVDILWVTIYNWWTGARKEDWAKWRDPFTVINEPWYRTFDRMKKLWKPIFIDEAWSTSIKVDGPYDELKLIDLYKQSHYREDSTTATGTKVKNDWINKLPELYTDPQVMWWAYFNADVTYWLNDRRQVGELDWMAIDPNKNFAYPAVLDILNSSKNLTFPTFYFDLNKKILNSKKWISEDQMLKIHEFISQIMVYKEGNLIVDWDYKGTYKYAKYQYYLEKRLKSDPILCEYINKKFPQIECSDAKKVENYEIKKKVFDYIINKVLTSPIKLSNWGICQQIEDYKVLLDIKSAKLNAGSNKYKIYEDILEYLNKYEKNFLELR